MIKVSSCVHNIGMIRVADTLPELGMGLLAVGCPKAAGEQETPRLVKGRVICAANGGAPYRLGIFSAEGVRHLEEAGFVH
jgi:hypothetical protein